MICPTILYFFSLSEFVYHAVASAAGAGTARGLGSVGFANPYMLHEVCGGKVESQSDSPVIQKTAVTVFRCAVQVFYSGEPLSQSNAGGASPRND